MLFYKSYDKDAIGKGFFLLFWSMVRSRWGDVSGLVTGRTVWVSNGACIMKCVAKPGTHRSEKQTLRIDRKHGGEDTLLVRIIW